MLLTGKATEHDVTPAYMKGTGVQIIRHTHSYAYARNGNAHNPTPKYHWRVFFDGKLADEKLNSAAAKELAHDLVVAAGRETPAQLARAVRRIAWHKSIKPPPRS